MEGDDKVCVVLNKQNRFLSNRFIIRGLVIEV